MNFTIILLSSKPQVKILFKDVYSKYSSGKMKEGTDGKNVDYVFVMQNQFSGKAALSRIPTKWHVFV